MTQQKLVIIDYGSGNIRSAAKAFEYICKIECLDFDIQVTCDALDVLKADRIVLPGQGAFRDCMEGLSDLSGMIEALEESVLRDKRPFLGICVGMQLLAERGLEHGDCQGLGWIPGDIVPLSSSDPTLKIPHMGWNNVEFERDHPILKNFAATHEKKKENNLSHFYFVHSFMFQCKEREDLLGRTFYGTEVTAAVARENIAGVQFHPEKSQEAGLAFLSGFLQWTP